MSGCIHLNLYRPSWKPSRLTQTQMMLSGESHPIQLVDGTQVYTAGRLVPFLVTGAPLCLPTEVNQLAKYILHVYINEDVYVLHNVI